MDTTLAHSEDKTIFAGVVTGQIAGLIMAVAVMAVFTILGKGPFFPVQVIGSTLMGEKALEGLNLTAFLTGVVLHQIGPSLLWGIVFSLIASKTDINNTKSSLFLGLFIGIISMVGPYLLIPLVMKTIHGVDFWNREVPMFWDWSAHIIFGASFALYPTIKTKLLK